MPYDFPGDPELAALIGEEVTAAGSWMTPIDDPCLPIHYPTTNLLPFLQGDERWVSVSTAQTAETDDFLLVGEAIGGPSRASGRRVGAAGQRGDEPHVLEAERSCGPHEASDPVHIRTPEARAADLERLGRLEAGDHAAVVDTMPEFLRHKPEAMFGHYLMMVGAIGGRDCTAPGVRYSDYENSIGTGQVHVWFDRPAERLDGTVASRDLTVRPVTQWAWMVRPSVVPPGTARHAERAKRVRPSERGAVGDLERLQVAVEVERVVATLAADAADAEAAEARPGRARGSVLTHTPPPAPPARPARPAPATTCRRSADARTSVELASTIASSSPANVCNVNTGPKTSCCTTSLSLRVGPISVGSHQASGRRPAAAERPCRRRARPLDRTPSTRSTWSGWIIGEIVVAGSRLSPSTCASMNRVEPLEEVIARPTRRRAVACRTGRPGPSRRTGPAALPRRRRRRRQRARRAVPFRRAGRERYEVASGGVNDVAGRLWRPGEGDPPHVRIADQRRADLLARCPARG